MADLKKPTKPAETFVHAAEAAARPAEDMMQSAARFEFPKMELPHAYRDLAEKGIAQAKQNYERMKTAAEESSSLMETTFSTASKGFSEYTLKVLDVMRANVNAHFDFAGSLFAVKSPSEAVELSSAHARKQFETITSQSKELASLAQKVSTEAAEPMKAGLNKALRLVA